MSEPRKVYVDRIADIESLTEIVSAHFHTRPPGDPRWIRLGKADRQAWQVATYTHSDRQLRYLYLGPDGRIAVVARGNTQGSKRSPHVAVLVDVSSLRNNQTPDNERMTRALQEGLKLLEPRRPMQLPRVLRR